MSLLSSSALANDPTDLVVPELLIPVHDDRGAFGRVAVLVRVGGNARHAGEAEVERRDRKTGWKKKTRRETESQKKR